MNRQIKFRVWDKIRKTLFVIDGLDLGYETIFAGYIKDAVGNISGFDNGREIPFTDVVVQQFTGVLDINGKEIYEGDIIRAGRGRQFIQKVEYDDYFAGFLPFILRLDEERECYSYQPEVIGNIFENPHLIK